MALAQARDPPVRSLIHVQSLTPKVSAPIVVQLLTFECREWLIQSERHRPAPTSRVAQVWLHPQFPLIDSHDSVLFEGDCVIFATDLGSQPKIALITQLHPAHKGNQ